MKSINVIEFSEIPENAIAFSLNAQLAFNEIVNAAVSQYVPWQLLDSDVDNFEPIDQWILQTYPELRNTDFIIELD